MVTGAHVACWTYVESWAGSSKYQTRRSVVPRWTGGPLGSPPTTQIGMARSNRACPSFAYAVVIQTGKPLESETFRTVTTNHARRPDGVQSGVTNVIRSRATSALQALADGGRAGRMTTV